MKIVLVEKESEKNVNFFLFEKDRKNWIIFSLVKDQNRTCSEYHPSHGCISGESSPSTNLVDRQFLPEDHGKVWQRLGILIKMWTRNKTASRNFYQCHSYTIQQVESEIEKKLVYVYSNVGFLNLNYCKSAGVFFVLILRSHKWEIYYTCSHAKLASYAMEKKRVRQIFYCFFFWKCEAKPNKKEARDETELSRWSEQRKRASDKGLSETWPADRREVSRVSALPYITYDDINKPPTTTMNCSRKASNRCFLPRAVISTLHVMHHPSRGPHFGLSNTFFWGLCVKITYRMIKIPYSVVFQWAQIHWKQNFLVKIFKRNCFCDWAKKLERWSLPSGEQ